MTTSCREHSLVATPDDGSLGVSVRMQPGRRTGRGQSCSPSHWDSLARRRGVLATIVMSWARVMLS